MRFFTGEYKGLGWVVQKGLWRLRVVEGVVEVVVELLLPLLLLRSVCGAFHIPRASRLKTFWSPADKRPLSFLLPPIKARP